jgi:membrane fusion protein, multidrug efflux system
VAHVPSDPVPHDELGFELPPPPTVSRRALALGGGAAVILAGAFLASWLPARHERAHLVEAARVTGQAPLRVRVVRPQAGEERRAVSLPATVQADRETDLFARASGYLRAWHVDLGDHVAAGQLLADIDTPDLDQELAQARAALGQARAGVAQAEARRQFASVTLERYQKLAPSGFTSQQELEQHRAEAQVAEADLTAARATQAAGEANVRRLSELKGFARVTAPFAGVVTQRYVEVGSLVSPGTSSGKPLFRLVASDRVRVTVNVPQHYAPSVQLGDAAAVAVRELAGREFEGKVTRTSGALERGSRSMTLQVDVPNPRGELYAGMYAEVKLRLAEPHPLLVLPGSAVRTSARGLEVAVAREGKVLLVPIVVERDTGLHVEVSDGIAADAEVILNPPASAAEGAAVEVVQDTPVR